MRIRATRRRGGFQFAHAGRLEEEIATLEKRLDQIGPDGDCGYEKALIRFFRDQIELRRRQLAFTAGR